MHNHAEVSQDQADSRHAQAHAFFQAAIREWADVADDPNEVKLRIATLLRYCSSVEYLVRER